MSGEVVVWSAGEIACDVVVGPSGGMPSRFVAVASYDRALAERDRARDIAARLEGEIAHLREVGCSPAPRVAHRPDRTPWPHPDAEVGA